MNIGITGLGSYLPETVVKNSDLEKFLDTSDEWITERTGIKERRIATSKESLPIMMAIAANRALKDANLSAADINYIFVGTNSTDPMLVPAVAPRVQYLLDAEEIPCWDLGNGCTGVIAATETAFRFIREIGDNEKEKFEGKERPKRTRALVIGGDILSNVAPFDDRNSAIILSDGAGAAVIEPIFDDDMGIKHIINRANGSMGNLIHYESGFGNQLVSINPVRFEKGKNDPGYFLMDGNKVHKFIARQSSDLFKELFKKSCLSLETLAETVVIPHQMNLRSIEFFLKQIKEDFGCKPKHVYTDGIINYGNNSTASTLIGLDECYRGGKLDLYDPVVVVAFGAGLTWGGFLTIWNKEKIAGTVKYDMGEQREMLHELNEKYDDWKKGLAR